MGKVRRSVERIDDPLPFRGAEQTGGAGLFCKNGVLGISLANAANDESFGLFVRNRNQVRSSFELNLFVAAHVMLQNIAGRSSEIRR